MIFIWPSACRLQPTVYVGMPAMCGTITTCDVCAMQLWLRADIILVSGHHNATNHAFGIGKQIIVELSDYRFHWLSHFTCTTSSQIRPIFPWWGVLTPQKGICLVQVFCFVPQVGMIFVRCYKAWCSSSFCWREWCAWCAHWRERFHDSWDSRNDENVRCAQCAWQCK